MWECMKGAALSSSQKRFVTCDPKQVPGMSEEIQYRTSRLRPKQNRNKVSPKIIVQRSKFVKLTGYHHIRKHQLYRPWTVAGLRNETQHFLTARWLNESADWHYSRNFFQTPFDLSPPSLLYRTFNLLRCHHISVIILTCWLMRKKSTTDQC